MQRIVAFTDLQLENINYLYTSSFTIIKLTESKFLGMPGQYYVGQSQESWIKLLKFLAESQHYIPDN